MSNKDKGCFGYNSLLDPHLRERQSRLYFGDKATRKRLLRAGLLRKSASGLEVNKKPPALASFDPSVRVDDQKRLKARREAAAARAARVKGYDRPASAARARPTSAARRKRPTSAHAHNIRRLSLTSAAAASEREKSAMELLKKGVIPKDVGVENTPPQLPAASSTPGVDTTPRSAAHVAHTPAPSTPHSDLYSEDSDHAPLSPVTSPTPPRLPTSSPVQPAVHHTRRASAASMAMLSQLSAAMEVSQWEQSSEAPVDRRASLYGKDVALGGATTLASTTLLMAPSTPSVRRRRARGKRNKAQTMEDFEEYQEACKFSKRTANMLRHLEQINATIEATQHRITWYKQGLGSRRAVQENEAALKKMKYAMGQRLKSAAHAESLELAAAQDIRNDVNSYRLENLALHRSNAATEASVTAVCSQNAGLMETLDHARHQLVQLDTLRQEAKAIGQARLRVLERRLQHLDDSEREQYLKDAWKRLMGPLSTTPAEIMQQIKEARKRKAKARWRRALRLIATSARFAKEMRMKRLYNELVAGVALPGVEINDAEDLAAALESRMMRLSNAMAEAGDLQRQGRLLEADIAATHKQIKEEQERHAQGESVNDRAKLDMDRRLKAALAGRAALTPLQGKTKEQLEAVEAGVNAMFDALVGHGFVASGTDVERLATLAPAWGAGVGDGGTTHTQVSTRLGLVAEATEELLRKVRPAGSPPRPVPAHQVLALAESGRKSVAAVKAGTPPAVLPTTKTHWRRRSLQDVKSILALRDKLAESTLAAVQRAGSPAAPSPPPAVAPAAATRRRHTVRPATAGAHTVRPASAGAQRRHTARPATAGAQRRTPFQASGGKRGSLRPRRATVRPVSAATRRRSSVERGRKPRASVSSLPDRVMSVLEQSVADVPETLHSLVLLEKSRQMVEHERRKKAAQLAMLDAVLGEA